MRGAISAGANVALDALIGEAEPFDRTDSTSAGAYCWAAMASRRSVEGASVYYEELREGFISLRRGLRGGKVVDLSLLVNAVTEGGKAYDFDRLLRHPADNRVYATSALDAKKVAFLIGENALQAESQEDQDGYCIPCKSKEDIAIALEATAHLTYYAGTPVPHGDLLLMDGGITAGRVPLQEAIADGSTHVLVVSTDRVTDPELYKKKLEEKIAVRAIRRQFPFLADRYWAGLERHVETLHLLKLAEAGELTTPQIDVIKADPAYIPRSMETNPYKLFLAAKAGEEAVLRAFQAHGLNRDTGKTVRLPRT